MNRKSPSSLPVQARISTIIGAVLRGPEKGILVLGIIFLSLTVASFVFEGSRPSPLGKAGVAVGLLGLLALLYGWWRLAESSGSSEGPTTTISVSDKDATIIAPVRAPEESIHLLREMIQHRRPPTEPYGEVTGAGPSDSGGLRVLSSEERRRAVEDLAKEIDRRDKDLLSELKRIEELVCAKAIGEEEDAPPQTPVEQPPSG